MTVRAILLAKGTDVITTRPDASVDEVVRVLGRRGVGAVVVQATDGSVLGVLSERDVIAAMTQHGVSAMSLPAYEVMHEPVTCTSEDSLPYVMSLMTSRRTRHLPVVEGGRLRGLVSIGDVVKHRLEEAEQETSVLREYIIYAG